MHGRTFMFEMRAWAYIYVRNASLSTKNNASSKHGGSKRMPDKR